MQRYSSVRIGGNIYIINGKDKNVIRSKDNPNYASLSVNGVYFTNRTSKPYSLMLACADLQDKYDLLIYYRKKQAENKHFKECITACSTKLLRIIFAMCKNNSLYVQK